jgi:hypothetical protein
MECDVCDVDVGFVKCGPYHCYECGASEIGLGSSLEFKSRAEMKAALERDDLDEDEFRTGFYKNRISPHANTVFGTLVDHKTAKRLYELGLLDPKPNDPQ